jgi:CRP-like cAMP-binding protein
LKSIFNQLLERPNFKEGLIWQKSCLEANETIINEGEKSGCVYLLLEGGARVVGNVSLGGERVLHPGFRDLKVGEVFGELSLLDDEPHSTSVMALEKCVVAVIKNDLLISYLEENPVDGYRVFKVLATTLVDRLRKTNKKAFSLYAWGLKAHGFDEYLK